jgi:hypothetical protein
MGRVPVVTSFPPGSPIMLVIAGGQQSRPREGIGPAAECVDQVVRHLYLGAPFSVLSPGRFPRFPLPLVEQRCQFGDPPSAEVL